MEELTRIIKEDMRPALGVTEPGAVAFAAATARTYTKGPVKRVKIALNSGMYKNGYSCGIAGTDKTGTAYAAALGVIEGNAGAGLEGLADITDAGIEAAEKMINEGKVEVVMDHMGSEITIDALVEAGGDQCRVKIAGGHTDIYEIICNDEIVLENAQCHQAAAKVVIHNYSLNQLLDYVKNVLVKELSFIKEAFTLNMELLETGLASDRTIFGPRLLRENGNQMISQDLLKTAQLMCNGAIEARVLGLDKPAMSVTGSGAHGIIATLPLYAVYKGAGIAEDLLLRGTALSILITMYIKEYSGKLSAFCGCAIAAGTGMACGLAYLRDGDEAVITRVIQNMASGMTGMICDGGNQGCVMKGIIAVDAAFRAVDLAADGVYIDKCHGINGMTAEATMKNMGMIASPGMIETEKTIIEIMQQK